MPSIKSAQIVTELIEQKIFIIRGQKVMISAHLSQLYSVETRVLMQAVKRNKDRFPKDFAFALTREEIGRISQFVTSLKYSKSVFAFTEQGIAMLSSVLHSKQAVHVNIAIMRTFVKLRTLINSNKQLALKMAKIEERLDKHDNDIRLVFNAIRQLMAIPDKGEAYKTNKIGFIVDKEDSK
jgi:hypothetical protein